MTTFALQCAASRWSTGSTCPRSPGARRFSPPSSICSSCDLSPSRRSSGTTSARFVTNRDIPCGSARTHLHLTPPSLLLHSDQCLPAAGHQQEQWHSRQEAAVLSTHPGPLYWLGGVHHHASSEFPLLSEARRNVCGEFSTGMLEICASERPM